MSTGNVTSETETDEIPGYRSVDMTVSVDQLKILDTWMDFNLVMNLIGNARSAGFDAGNHVLRNDRNKEWLKFLEENEMAFMDARHGWYGLGKLEEYCRENHPDFFD
jgi:hypothetical protein